MKRMLADVCPELINEWSQRNLPLTPDSVTHGSNKIVWWNGKCGHEWRASIKNRVISGSGCPYCSHNAILEGYNDLASQKPELAAEWSARNAPLLPTQVTVFANRKAWWKCKECGNEWETLISTRSDGSKCPYCSGYILLKGFNDFATLYPQLAEEWSDRNLPLTPDTVNDKSRKNVWWKCRTCGYEWKSVIHSRAKGAMCPVCADRAVDQWLDGSEEPEAGMIIFFDWASDGLDGSGDHTGIVEKVEGGTVYTIEGNSGDKVCENQYSIGNKEILGYGYYSGNNTVATGDVAQQVWTYLKS